MLLCSAICSHHKCKTSVRRVRVSVACAQYSLTQQRIQAYLHTARHPDSCSRLATIDMGRKKLGRAVVPLWVGGAGSPSNTMSLEPRTTSVPSGILIHETVWPEYTCVTDDRQTTSHDNSRTLHCNGRLKTRMWATAQHDGRAAEYKWRPLFNAVVWLTPTTRVPCSNAAKTPKPLKFTGVPSDNEKHRQTFVHIA